MKDPDLRTPSGLPSAGRVLPTGQRRPAIDKQVQIDQLLLDFSRGNNFQRIGHFRDQVIRKHLSAKDLSFVIITKDAEGLKQQLLSDAFSPIKYDGEKPAELLAEDKVIGVLKLNLSADKVRITRVEDVFAK